MQDDEYRIVIYQGFSQQIIAGKTEILDAAEYYEYVYNKSSNKIGESSIGSPKIAYPRQSLIDAFEQEISKRLQNC